MNWLSHHPPEEYDRCIRLGGVHVCARCLGTYPVLFLVMAAQFALRAPLAHPWDLPVGLALVVPAVADWARGRFRPHGGTNALRLATGVLLGAGLGRSLYVHLQRPLPPVLVAQLGLAAGVAMLVFSAIWLGRRRE